MYSVLMFQSRRIYNLEFALFIDIIQYFYFKEKSHPLLY